MTNQELYRAIGELGERYAASGRALEQYLSALLGLARQHCCESVPESLSPFDFIRLLSEAFTAEPLTFEAKWREEYSALNAELPGYAGWEAVLLQQVVDLREMDEAGTLDNPHRYFGVNAPRGSKWVNFDPVTYLECAMAGSFGGWEPTESTGRQFVPGQVAIMDSQGNVQSVDPQSVERPIVMLTQISWEEFQEFLVCGQTYE